MTTSPLYFSVMHKILGARFARFEHRTARLDGWGGVSLAAVVALMGCVNIAPAIGADGGPRPYGSGAFGRWIEDGFALPAYRIEIDERSPSATLHINQSDGPASPFAPGYPVVHRVGNDHISGYAYNMGYTQFWIQDRERQWLNFYDEAAAHYAGGYGYLKIGDRLFTSVQIDQPKGHVAGSEFGIGYVRRAVKAGALNLEEHVYAPFGDDSVLLHDVTITNTGNEGQKAVWWEYWDVNPTVADVGGGDPSITSEKYGSVKAILDGNLKLKMVQRGIDSPKFDGERSALTVRQRSYESDNASSSIFLVALNAPVDGFETRTHAFFGDGGRQSPSEAIVDRAGNGLSAPTENGDSGDCLLVLRSPIDLQPGQSVTLRYAYGAANPNRIGAIVDKYRGATNFLAESERRWLEWLPVSNFGENYIWLSRELKWSAYYERSGLAYDEVWGHRSAGGAGGNGLGVVGLAPPEAVSYTSAELSRDLFRFALILQDPLTGERPDSLGNMGKVLNENDNKILTDSDCWLLGTLAFSMKGSRFGREVTPRCGIT